MYVVILGICENGVEGEQIDQGLKNVLELTTRLCTELSKKEED
jgi:hypothetical protein